MDLMVTVKDEHEAARKYFDLYTSIRQFCHELYSKIIFF